MNFKHDLAKIAQHELQQAGIVLPQGLNDYQICIRYLDLKLRSLDTNERYHIVYSKEYCRTIHTLTMDEQRSIHDIEYKLMNGLDITCYMSKGIKKVAIRDSDFLLKNWGIYHLHLEKANPNKAYSNPNLLFFIRWRSVIHFIDVRIHPKGQEWFVRDMITTIYRNWPWLLNYFDGYKPIYTIPDNQVHNALKHMMSGIPFENGMLMPTYGVMSSGDGGLAAKYVMKLFNSLSQSELNLVNEEESIKKGIASTTGINVSDSLDYELITEDGYFVAYENQSFAKIRLFKIPEI